MPTPDRQKGEADSHTPTSRAQESGDSVSVSVPDGSTPRRTSTQRSRRPVPLKADEREAKQHQFLDVYRECANVYAAALKVGVDRTTIYDWRRRYKWFDEAFTLADQDATDILFGVAWQMAVFGQEEPLVSQGQLVYDYQEVRDPRTGRVLLDEKGKPVTRKVPATKTTRSVPIILRLLGSRLPKYSEQQHQVELTGLDGGPIQTESHTHVHIVLPEVMRLEDDEEEGGEAHLLGGEVAGYLASDGLDRDEGDDGL